MATNKQQSKAQYRKSKRTLGMTPLQIITLIILACGMLTIIAVLIGMILNNTLPSTKPTSYSTNIPPVVTSRPNNKSNDCDAVDVKTWIDETELRLFLTDADLNYLSSLEISNYDDFKPYANRAKERYYAQSSQQTPACLESVQEITLEELRLFWKGLDAFASGDSAGEEYLSRYLEISFRVDQAIQEIVQERGINIETSVKTPQPTLTLTPTITPTPTPIKIYLDGGDIGWMLTKEDYSVALLSAYQIDQINGEKPSGSRNGGVRGGFTHFLVLELEFERLTPGYSDFNSGFWLWSYDDQNFVEYRADRSYVQDDSSLRVYFQEKKRWNIVFEIMPDSNHLIFCYKNGVAQKDGFMVSKCDNIYGFGFQIK